MVLYKRKKGSDMHYLKIVVGIMFLIAPSACTPDAMIMANPSGTLDMMSGTGSVARSSSDNTTFRFVILENAYAGILDTPDQLKSQNSLMLSQWVEKRDICKNGYTVAEPQLVQGSFVYDGICKEP